MRGHTNIETANYSFYLLVPHYNQYLVFWLLFDDADLKSCCLKQYNYLFAVFRKQRRKKDGSGGRRNVYR